MEHDAKQETEVGEGISEFFVQLHDLSKNIAHAGQVLIPVFQGVSETLRTSSIFSQLTEVGREFKRLLPLLEKFHKIDKELSAFEQIGWLPHETTPFNIALSEDSIKTFAQEWMRTT